MKSAILSRDLTSMPCVIIHNKIVLICIKNACFMKLQNKCNRQVMYSVMPKMKTYN